MKTRRNHRKTTNRRRRRHVKQRVQTRFHHRKGTVSSGRRHKFFKRGGEPLDDNLSNITKFVEGITPVNVKRILDGEGYTDIPSLTVIKVGDCSKSSFNIKEFGIQIPVSKRINEITVEFFIHSDACNVDIYVGETRYGRVRIKIGNIVMDTDICNYRYRILANAIKTDLIEGAK
jgi:hypothetical protein